LNVFLIQAAFMYYRRKERGEDVDFTPEELASCMKNQSPGMAPIRSIDFRFS
jgi:4-aminobutyrate aminotransferase / (S)-3-amino-2-methylpropionate transaminase